MVGAVNELLHSSAAQLDDLFATGAAEPIPRGEGDGTVLVEPGTQLAGPAAKLVHLLAWQGKVFDPDRGELRNEILPFGLHAIRAKVYRDASWVDGKDAIVLDYSKTSLVAHWIRDEIRLVGPGIYLGVVFWERARLLRFALAFPS